MVIEKSMSISYFLSLYSFLSCFTSSNDKSHFFAIIWSFNTSSKFLAISLCFSIFPSSIPSLNIFCPNGDIRIFLPNSSLISTLNFTSNNKIVLYLIIIKSHRFYIYDF